MLLLLYGSGFQSKIRYALVNAYNRTATVLQTFSKLNSSRFLATRQTGVSTSVIQIPVITPSPPTTPIIPNRREMRGFALV